MSTPNITEQNKLSELEAAFELFNQTSTQLTHAYESLQLQVEDLQQKLDQSHLEKQKVDERLKQLLNLLPAGVIVLNLENVVVEMNPVAASIFGENAKFKSWNELVSEVFLTGNDAGTYFTSAQKAYQLSEAPLTFTEDGDSSSLEGRILIIQDVTDARKLQQHIDRHQRLNSLGDMTASLAHQIRTPLASALLYISQVDSEDLDDEKRTKFVSKSVNSLRHLESLVKDMLQYAKGGKSFSKPILIVDLVRLLLQQVEPRVASSHSTFEIVPYDLSLEIFGDIDALLTALQNLIMNAIDVVHTHADIALEIVPVDLEPNKIDFKIMDKGPGLSEDLMAKIYEPFFTSRAQGTGLGLAVVKAVAEAHDGETWVESDTVKGTIFTLRLPAYNTKDLK
jgi:two-component system sensor histidine kinase FlrB